MKSTTHMVPGIRAARALAATILLAGIVVLTSGGLVWHVGVLGTARYERTSGKLARVFSTDDREYYDQLSWVSTVGAAATAVGGIAVAGGLVLLLFPHPLLGILGAQNMGTRKRNGVDAPSLQENGQKQVL